MDFFYAKKPKWLIPEGAATVGVQAAILSGDDNPPKLEDALLVTAVPLAIQVEVDGTSAVIILRYSSRPSKQSQTFSTSVDNQSVVVSEHG
ncbi:unnamed protein product [Phytophthora lilii]|uniref:Unnamed protein product n=1 Tax=Phytophthora lilii TaxID=2077276 RepID=A0A9W6U9J4_9STRA|nr:unnamed protein product [Phytophthora lilii]